MKNLLLIRFLGFFILVFSKLLFAGTLPAKKKAPVTLEQLASRYEKLMSAKALAWKEAESILNSLHSKGFINSSLWLRGDLLLKEKNPDPVNKYFGRVGKGKFRGMDGVLAYHIDKLKVSKLTSSGQDLFFFLKAINAFNRKEYKASLNYLSRIGVKSRYYRKAKFHEAYIFYLKKDFPKAAKTFKLILNQPVSKGKWQPFERHVYHQSALALARIFYANQQYKNAAFYYKKVKKPAYLWIDGLFEQAWAYFMMADYNRAMGNLHSLHSPFFKDFYMPESHILAVMVYFSLCQYDKAKKELYNYMTRYMQLGKKFTAFLETVKNANPEVFYKQWESYKQGIDEVYLQIPEMVWNTLKKEKDFQKLSDEIETWEAENLLFQDMPPTFKQSQLGNRVFEHIAGGTKRSQQALGQIIKTRLIQAQGIFEESFGQAKLLYIELMMGKKDQLMGTDKRNQSKLLRTAALKMEQSVVSHRSWTLDNKNEYWWDEVGHYIYDLKSLCRKGK